MIHTRNDIDAAPPQERAAFLAMLAASIYSTDANGELVTNTSAIEQFGFTVADFPDAPVAPYAAPGEAPTETEAPPISEWTRQPPSEIPAWRGRIILAGRGLLDEVETAIAALSEPQKTVAEIAWAHGAPWDRTGATVAMIASAIGLTDAEIDAMFIEAMEVEI